MVENFTQVNEKPYNSDSIEAILEIEDDFECIVKENIQQLAKNPSPKIIENILNYSTSLRKD